MPATRRSERIRHRLEAGTVATNSTPATANAAIRRRRRPVRRLTIDASSARINAEQPAAQTRGGRQSHEPALAAPVGNRSTPNLNLTGNNIVVRNNNAPAGPLAAGEMAARRLHREMSEFMRDPPGNCSIKPTEDGIFHWHATIIGPDGTPYESGVFNLDLHFPMDYPFNPPQIYFITKIYHCNISTSGSICMDILSLQWSPALTVAKVLLSILSLLSDANPNDPLETGIAILYKRDRTQHDKNARLWVKRYATQEEANSMQ